MVKKIVIIITIAVTVAAMIVNAVIAFRATHAIIVGVIVAQIVNY